MPFGWRQRALIAAAEIAWCEDLRLFFLPSSCALSLSAVALRMPRDWKCTRMPQLGRMPLPAHFYTFTLAEG
jgi:hypothetical protein